MKSDNIDRFEIRNYLRIWIQRGEIVSDLDTSPGKEIVSNLDTSEKELKQWGFWTGFSNGGK